MSPLTENGDGIFHSKKPQLSHLFIHKGNTNGNIVPFGIHHICCANDPLPIVAFMNPFSVFSFILNIYSPQLFNHNYHRVHHQFILKGVTECLYEVFAV